MPSSQKVLLYRVVEVAAVLPVGVVVEVAPVLLVGVVVEVAAALSVGVVVDVSSTIVDVGLSAGSTA